MQKNTFSTNDELHDQIDQIIKEICEIHSEENLEQDIIALFEDIIKYFSGKEEEFITLKSLPLNEQKEIYAEIKTIINLLKTLGHSADKKELLSMLSKSLIKKFSKTRTKTLLKKEEKLTAEEIKKIKEIFTRTMLHEIYLVQKDLPAQVINTSKFKALNEKYSSIKLAPKGPNKIPSSNTQAIKKNKF